MMRHILLAGILLIAGGVVHADQSFYLLTYKPGPNWTHGKSYDQQPGLDAHRTHLRGLFDNEVLLMSGAMDGETGAVAMIRVGSTEQAFRVADTDPGVETGILQVSVTGWNVSLSSMRQFRRASLSPRDPDEPFRVERLDPGAPINLKEKPER